MGYRVAGVRRKFSGRRRSRERDADMLRIG